MTDRPTLRDAVNEAAEGSILPAVTHAAYPGFFSVTADGQYFGREITYPGLDWWEIAGSLLRLGHLETVLRSFDFVAASQNSVGNIPFVILPAEPEPDRSTYFRGLDYPRDIYEWGGRRWIGLFRHWQTEANPLSSLGCCSFILTAAEVHLVSSDVVWLRSKLAALNAAGAFLGSLMRGDLIGGSGFYTEMPPRRGFDGVTQCFVIKSWRELAALHRACGEHAAAASWLNRASQLESSFHRHFWLDDHFAEHIREDGVPVDSHGLSDTNLAAIGLRVATDEQAGAAWQLITADGLFWRNNMPTWSVCAPEAYTADELHERLPFTPHLGPTHDAAAMGRVWHLDVLACARLGDWPRLWSSLRLVCRRGRTDGWLWYERYHASDVTSEAVGCGPKGYCEYPAILIRAAHDYGGSLQGLPAANVCEFDVR